MLVGLSSVAIAMAAGKKFTLVIDPGHGGHDPGAKGAVAYEKNINLKVALAFGRYVERNCPDVNVIYTRKTDVFIPLSERAAIANRNKADLFISIHSNSLPAGKISRGFETYTLGMHRAADNLEVAKRENSVILIEQNYQQRYAGFHLRSSESYIMFELMQDKNMANSVELAKMIQREACSLSGRQNKGVHQAGFLVLRETSMPSCLIELGFISTPDEEEFLNSSSGQGRWIERPMITGMRNKPNDARHGVLTASRWRVPDRLNKLNNPNLPSDKRRLPCLSNSCHRLRASNSHNPHCKPTLQKHSLCSRCTYFRATGLYGLAAHNSKEWKTWSRSRKEGA